MTEDGSINAGARRLARLRAMSAREIAVRLRYAAYCRFERHAHRHARLTAPTRVRDALVPRLQRPDWQGRLLASRDERRSDFFAGTREPDRMRALFEGAYRRERDAAIESADRVMRGEIEFFGATFTVHTPVRWNHDPVGGAEWPRRYHRDVPIHGGNRGWGDVKYVWELNRHQFLIDLGRAAFLTGEPRYAARTRELVADWLADNPYATGVNWACALEPAFRTLSWLWTYFLCYDEERRHPEHHLLWLTGFYDHARFLHRHLERYSSPYNHLVGEASALYLLGVLFPEFTEAAAWRARGKAVLEATWPQQFYADGGSREQSTGYHHATLAFYLLPAILARCHHDEFSPGVWGAIERATAFSAALVQPNGRTPAIGGADDGKPLRMEHLPLWDFRPFQSLGAVLFERADFKQAAGRFFEDALWVLGPEGWTRFNSVAPDAAAASSVALPASGYYVLRSGRPDHANYVCIDCGEQAGDVRSDAVPNSVHGHADCLSVIVSMDGRPVLVDAGLYCYNGDPEWEGHFRRTAAHNTARIDGADQALHLGKMAWAHSYVAREELWQAHKEGGAFIGSHDGYTRRGGDTVHRRLVWLRPAGYLVVYDEFECRREHDVELAFQFAPGELRNVRPGLAVFNDDIQFGWTASTDLQVSICEGGPAPDSGWIAPSLGVRLAAPRLALSGRIGPGSGTLTVLASPPSAAQVDRLPVGTDNPQRGMIRVTGLDFVDYIAGRALTRGGMPGDTDGRVAIWQFRDGQNVEAVQVGGTFVTPARSLPSED